MLPFEFVEGSKLSMMLDDGRTVELGTVTTGSAKMRKRARYTRRVHAWITRELKEQRPPRRVRTSGKIRRRVDRLRIDLVGTYTIALDLGEGVDVSKLWVNSVRVK